MVETGGLENRFTLSGNGGSNPSPSATKTFIINGLVGLAAKHPDLDFCFWSTTGAL